MKCESALQVERVRANPEAHNAHLRRARAADPERVRATTNRNVARYRERHRERLAEEARERKRDPAIKARFRLMWNAGNAVRAAIKRGALVKPDTCQECGGPGPIEAAHHDYSRPLEVRWLCRFCHRRWDAAEAKTGK